MDIKLKAKLAAYARVETFASSSTTPGTDGCDLVTTGPVREELIDTLFSEETSSTKDKTITAGTPFIDSLFQKE